MCYNSSRKPNKSKVKVCLQKAGAEMKYLRLTGICLICLMLFTVTGCQGTKKPVVNAQSGVVIHANDFTGGFKEKAASANQIRQVSAPTAKSSGAVIDLSGGYEKIEMGPLFDSVQ